MNNLKSCPFCGGVAKLNAPDYKYCSPYWCKCTRCGAEGPTKSSELEAETGWNKRAQDDVENAPIIDSRKHDMDMDIEMVDGRRSRSMNDYLECIVKFQNGIEVGYREELVRCKNCIHRGKSEKCVLAAISEEKNYLLFMLDNRGEWFCADGKRAET